MGKKIEVGSVIEMGKEHRILQEIDGMRIEQMELFKSLRNTLELMESAIQLLDQEFTNVARQTHPELDNFHFTIQLRDHKYIVTSIK
jgi:exonuclease III